MRKSAPSVALSTLKPFAGFGFKKPEAGDLAVINPDTREIMMFAKSKGKGSRAAMNMVEINSHQGMLVWLA